MFKGRKKKVAIIITILLGLFTGLIMNMLYSSDPLVKWLFVSPKFGKVIFNNYNITDTLQLAKKYVEEGDGKSAFLTYNDVLKKDPNNIEAYVGLADLYGRMYNFKEAERYIDEAEKRITPQTSSEMIADVYYHEAIIYDSTFKYEGYKNTDKAIEYYHKALNSLNENSVNLQYKKEYESFIYFYLGQTYSSIGKEDIALECYKKSMEANPEDKALHYSMGITYIMLKEYEKAYESLLTYQDAFGRNDSLVGFGYYYTEIGDYRKAKDYLTEAEQIDPSSYRTLFFYGNYYEKINNMIKAKEYYRKAFEMNIYTINDKNIQRTIERLNINVDDLKEQLEEEKEENYNKVFEL